MDHDDATMTGEIDESPLSLPLVIASHLQSVLGDDILENAEIQEAKSAQQQVYIVTLSCTREHLCRVSSCWLEALRSGNNSIVIRIWKGAARWWNLHSSHALSEFNESSTEPGVLLLARAEVAGYRLARKALLDSQVEIPQVLHFSHDSNTYSEKQPWAIMSYVGPHSAFFDNECRVATDEWLNGMITIRAEFGFDEPHPRWGRVPVDQCLDYALHVLERFTIPMHRYFLRTKEHALGNSTLNPRGYADMIQLYKKAYGMMIQGIQNDSGDETLTRIVRTLGLCIQQLQDESYQVEDLPLVLCHMDCQPQNLIFYRVEESGIPLLHSVLDWEEASLADPRFEILLLCRQVCANMEQAKALWDFYNHEIEQMDSGWTVGPIDPWMKLETVHSITTLVLQSMNLLNGGRSPWESKPELLGKIEREFQRLVWMRWTFCKVINSNSGVP